MENTDFWLLEPKGCTRSTKGLDVGLRLGTGGFKELQKMALLYLDKNINLRRSHEAFSSVWKLIPQIYEALCLDFCLICF